MHVLVNTKVPSAQDFPTIVDVTLTFALPSLVQTAHVNECVFQKFRTKFVITECSMPVSQRSSFTRVP